MIYQPSLEPVPHRLNAHGGIATAEDGTVMLDGPNGVAVAMTPEAAMATGQSLVAAAEVAFGQRGRSKHPR